MSSSLKPKPRCYGSDIHRLLLAAEVGQKADILAYSSGHLGPHSLNQSQPHKETKPFFWRMSQSQEETQNPPSLQQIQTKTKKNEMKAFPPKFTSGTALAESRVLGSTHDHTSHAERREDISLPQMVYCPSGSLLVQQKACSQKKTKPPSDLEGNHQVGSSHSDQEGLSNEEQQEKKQCFGWQVVAKQDLWAGKNVAEMHEGKLQEELINLSAQSWPSRDRLAVFSDVFDDVCEGSPVFGRILREIKSEYDLYVNHLMTSQSSLQNMSLNTSLKDHDNHKVSETELDAAEKEVCRLEQEAGGALEEKKRVQNKLQNVSDIIQPKDSDKKNTALSGLQDTMTVSGCTDSIHFRSLQVLNVWKEIKQLEEELKEKLVSTAALTATKGFIKDQQTEIIKLIAANERLRSVSKDLENNINAVLNREKASKVIRRILWDEIHRDQQTE